MQQLLVPNQSFQLFSNFWLLVLDIGSNDLDKSGQPNLNPITLARELVHQAKDMGSNFHVQVVICLPIPWAESKFLGSFETTKVFNETFLA